MEENYNDIIEKVLAEYPDMVLQFDEETGIPIGFFLAKIMEYYTGDQTVYIDTTPITSLLLASLKREKRKLKIKKLFSDE
jgi:hypothetical protein